MAKTLKKYYFGIYIQIYLCNALQYCITPLKK